MYSDATPRIGIARIVQRSKAWAKSRCAPRGSGKVKYGLAECRHGEAGQRRRQSEVCAVMARCCAAEQSKGAASHCIAEVLPGVAKQRQSDLKYRHSNVPQGKVEQGDVAASLIGVVWRLCLV